MAISEKVDLKINDFFSKIKDLTNSFNLYKNALSVPTEYNSHTKNGFVYIAPSYMVDFNMIEKIKNFKNPLRKLTDDGEEEDGLHESYEVNFSGTNKETDNWLEASFYAVKDYFLGGRSGFYDKKNLVIIDKKKDRILTQDIQTDYEPDGGGLLGGICDINSIKVINDSLLEVKAGAILSFDLYDTTKYIDGGH